nr:Endonuclease [uncultured bacterium]
MNVGSPTQATVDRSIEVIAADLARGTRLGARGVVVHAGSAVDEHRYEAALRQLRERLLPVLDALPDDGPRLLVEPTAGGGRSLAATVEDLGPYLAALDMHPGVGVCLDTCHAWAAGHDLAAPGGTAATLDALEAAVGPGRLGLVHANDSLDPCGSRRDRHTTIGEGSIGTAAFAELMRHPSVAGVPVVVETPSAHRGHARDIALLCALRDGRPAGGVSAAA